MKTLSIEKMLNTTKFTDTVAGDGLWRSTADACLSFLWATSVAGVPSAIKALHHLEDPSSVILSFAIGPVTDEQAEKIEPLFLKLMEF